MQVNLVGLTKPSAYTGCNTAEELVVYCARVSNPKNQDNFGTGPKLLNHLIKEGHWSPFEMVHVNMEVRTTRDIARQILRHRSFSFQEFCVAEGTLVTTLTNSGKSKKVPIEQLYKRYKSDQYSKMSDWLVRVYDIESNTLKSAKVKEVFSFGNKECYELTLSNKKSIQCTKEHKFLTKRGFLRLADITTDDFIATNGIPVWQDKEWLLENKQLAIETGAGVPGIAEVAGCSYHTIRKWLKIHGLQFTKKEVASYTEAWNKGLPTEQQPRYGVPSSKETRLKQFDSARKGSDSNLYIHGEKCFDTMEFRLRVAKVCKGAHLTLLVNQNYKCNICDNPITRSTSEVDHILPVALYPELAYDEANNLQTLCKECHSVKTIEEYKRDTIVFTKVESIVNIGEKPVYDLEIEHVDHNYVANGIITHNSQRYAKVMDFSEPREARLQDTKNRQNSIRTSDSQLQEAWNMRQQSLLKTIEENYSWALEMGIAKEQARAILPEGLAMSTIYMSGTLRSWIHFCTVRMGNGTQLEHSDIAKACWEVLKQHFPITITACEMEV